MPQVVQFPSGHQVSFPDSLSPKDLSQAASNVWSVLGREVKAAGSALNPASLVQTVTAPMTDDEKADFAGHTPLPGEVSAERLLGRPIVTAGKWYRDALSGKVPDAYEQALSVAPEAIGGAGGAVVGGKALDTALGSASESVTPKRVVPVELGDARQVGDNIEHTIYVNREPVGLVNARIKNGSAEINWIGDKSMLPDEGLTNQLGPSAIKQMRAQFKDMHPEVKSISGIRIGGARGNQARTVTVNADLAGDAPEAPDAQPPAFAAVSPPTEAAPDLLMNTPAIPKFDTAATGGLPPRVATNLVNLYETAKPSFMTKEFPFEHSFVFNKEGMPGTITSSHSTMDNVVKLWPNTAGIVHSHPIGSDPKPSRADIDIAMKKKIPNYVLSRNQLWVATPDGKTRQVADVKYDNGQLQVNYR